MFVVQSLFTLSHTAQQEAERARFVVEKVSQLWRPAVAW